MIVDSKTLYCRGLTDYFPKHIPLATCTSDGLLSSDDKCKLNALDLDDWLDRVYDVATPDSDGLMSKEDKKKMDGIEVNANNYIHPNTPSIRHVTDSEKAYWNAKASTNVATQIVNGLMSAADKKKLDEIEAKANNYIHPNTPSIRHVTDTQINYWNAKASTAVATQTSDGLMSKEDKKKLDNILLVTHERDGLMSKEDKIKLDGIVLVSYDTDGLMSVADKKKLDGIEENANHYVHPDNSSIRHVTDAQIEYFAGKADKYVATPTEDGLMSAKDKTRLDNIETNANNYVHPNTPEMRHVTDEQILLWDNKADRGVATHDLSGLMSYEDKIKLDKINLTSGSPDIDTPTHRHVTDTLITTWNNKAEKSVVSNSANGLMAIADKKKLDQLKVIIKKDLSLLASAWSNGVQKLNVDGINSSSDLYIGPKLNQLFPVEQKKIRQAKLSVTIEESNKITFNVLGVVPDIDIPVSVIIF